MTSGTDICARIARRYASSYSPTGIFTQTSVDGSREESGGRPRLLTPIASVRLLEEEPASTGFIILNRSD